MRPEDCRALMNRMNEQGHFPQAFLPFMDLDTGAPFGPPVHKNVWQV